MEKSTYKYCIVPQCGNTSVATPEKLFFCVPKDQKCRKKWCAIMRRRDRRPLSTKTALYCCEDHFDVETDMENYLRFKMMGGLKLLRKGVVPHKFACQGREIKTLDRPGYKKIQHIELLKSALSPNICHENLLPQSPVFQECGTEFDTNNTNILDPLSDGMPSNSPHTSTRRSVGVQVNIKPKYRSKATDTETDAKRILKPKVFRKRKHKEPLMDQSATSQSSSSACTISLESFSTEDARKVQKKKKKLKSNICQNEH